MKTGSIRTKLVVFFLAAALVPMATLGGLFYYKSVDSLNQSVSAGLAAVAANQVEFTSYWLNNQLQNIQIMAASEEVKSFDLNRITVYFHEMIQRCQDYDSIFLIDTSGVTQFQSDGGSGVNLGDRQYFKDALQAKSTISDVITSRITNNKVFIVAAPVMDGTEVVAVLAAGVTMEKISDVVNKMNLGETGEAYLINKRGEFITAAKDAGDKSRIERNESVAAQEIMAGNQGQSNYTNYRGKSVVGAYLPIPGTEWGLIAEQETSEAYAGANALFRYLLVIAGITLVLVVFLAFIITRSISRPIQKLADAAGVIASGDLTVVVEEGGRDEIGVLARAFRLMTENLQTLLQKVGQTGQSLATASEQMAASAEETSRATEQIATTVSEVAQGAGDTAHNVEEAAAQVEDMVQTVKEIEANANEVAAATGLAQETAEKGTLGVNAVVQKMDMIKERVDETASLVKSLGERSQEIGKIVDLIANIASQTNLLALNAAIEAARAGEQGRGFAVVADEVRKLAEESASATAQIAELIKRIQSETEQAVESMTTGTKEVDEGQMVVQQAGEAFKEIAGAIEGINGQVKGISSAIQMLSKSADTFAEAMSNISAITEETAASAEEVSAATEEQTASVQQIAATAHTLVELADELQAGVNRFKLSREDLNCWEFCGCPEEHYSKCAAYKNPEHRCWLIPDTYYDPEQYSSSAEKKKECRNCQFYQKMSGSKNPQLPDSTADLSRKGS